MKITGIETFSLRSTLPYSLTTARGESLEREAILVKLLTDEPSISGWGEAGRIICSDTYSACQRKRRRTLQLRSQAV